MQDRAALADTGRDGKVCSENGHYGTRQDDMETQGIERYKLRTRRNRSKPGRKDCRGRAWQNENGKAKQERVE